MRLGAKRELVYSFCDNNSSSCDFCKLNCGGWKHQCISYECPDIENMDEKELDRALRLIYGEEKQECAEKEGLTYEESLSVLKALRKSTRSKDECEALDDAIEVMQNRIAKSPEPFGHYHARCPVCKSTVQTFWGYNRVSFCHECGQCLKWGL